MIGDSIVSWAGQNNAQLDGAGITSWKGRRRRGARMAETTIRLRNYLRNQPYPTTLFVHVGTNDLFSVPIHALRRVLLETMISIRTLLPGTRIIWYDILHRLFYYGIIPQRGR